MHQHNVTKSLEYSGIYTALITPFTPQNQLDINTLHTLILRQIEAGIRGVVIAGSTGEAFSLTLEERRILLKESIGITQGRVPLVYGATAANTYDAINHALMAKECGATAVLIAPPFYVKPTQECIYRHFNAIADAVDIDIIIYNIPSRCGVDMHDDTIVEVSRHKNIVALKDATGNLSRVSTLLNKFREKRIPPIILFSGEDITSLAFNALGGDGCISVTSNIYPGYCQRLDDLSKTAPLSEALKLHKALVPIHLALSCKTNPIPVKYAMHHLLGINEAVRLPLTGLNESEKECIKRVMQQFEEEV